MDTLPTADQTPLLAFRRGAVPKTRIPYDRHRNRAPIGKIDAKSVSRDLDGLRMRLVEVVSLQDRYSFSEALFLASRSFIIA